jgi:hypothetical protein
VNGGDENDRAVSVRKNGALSSLTDDERVRALLRIDSRDLHLQTPRAKESGLRVRLSAGLNSDSRRVYISLDVRGIGVVRLAAAV